MLELHIVFVVSCKTSGLFSSQTYSNRLRSENLNHGDEVSIILCNDLDVDSLQILEGEHVTDQCLQEVVSKLDSLK